MKMFLNAALLMAAVCVSGIAQVKQVDLPKEMNGCLVLKHQGVNSLVMECGEFVFKVQLAHVVAPPADAPAMSDTLFSVVYDARRGDRFFSTLDKKKEETDGLFTVRTISATPSGAIVAEVFVETGDRAGQNVGVAVLNSGAGVVSSAEAPFEYRAASIKGNAERKRRAEWAKAKVDTDALKPEKP